MTVWLAVAGVSVVLLGAAGQADLVFTGGYAHRPWMNLFLGHIAFHFVPGRNWTWLVVFLAALAAYLVAVDRASPLVVAR